VFQGESKLRQYATKWRNAKPVGLDLGDRSSWYCMLDEGGAILREQRVSTTAKALGEVFDNVPRGPAFSWKAISLACAFVSRHYHNFASFIRPWAG